MKENVEQEEQIEEDNFGSGGPMLTNAEETAEKPDEDDQTDLASEALEELSETPAGSAEDRVPLSKYMGEKKGRREAELEAAELRGRMAERDKLDTTKAVAEKGPVERLMEEQGVTAEADLDLTTGEAMSLMRKEAAWEKTQDAKSSAATTEADKQKLLNDQFAATSAKDRGEGLDYASILKEGEKLLTKGQLVDINDASEPYELAYDLMLEAIQRKGTDQAKELLQTRLDARKTKPDPDPKKPKEKAAATEEDEGSETNDEKLEPIVNERLASLAQSAFVSQE